jgi:predicted RNA-binding protein with RPS1 domain
VFGVFVDVSVGTDVLLPRSILSRGNYEKLKKLADSKSQEKVKVELVSISAENKTLSGKYVSSNYRKDRSDLSALDGKDIATQFFNATVISAHEFGIFAELDDYGVEGLVPASRLPEKLPAESIQTSFPAGKAITVQIEEMNVGDKKLVLSMKFESRAPVDAFAAVPQTKWFTGIVQSVSNFGLFVRPAGYDATGLVHASRIPRDLLASLKKMAPIAPGTNTTDIEALFSENDVVKVRVHSVNAASRRLELSMLPFKGQDEAEDDYIVEGREPEGQETNFSEIDEDEEEGGDYNAEGTLLWWKGKPFAHDSSADAAEDEEAGVLSENAKVIEGTWRRMFEIDMREDELDFSSKIAEEERKELEEELGELMGLDEDMGDDFLDLGTKFNVKTMGSFISASDLPAEWKSQMDFYKELDSFETTKLSSLKRGKVAEAEEFDKLLREVEVELENAATRAPKREAPPAPEAAEEAPPASE